MNVQATIPLYSCFLGFFMMFWAKKSWIYREVTSEAMMLKGGPETGTVFRPEGALAMAQTMKIMNRTVPAMPMAMSYSAQWSIRLPIALAHVSINTAAMFQFDWYPSMAFIYPQVWLNSKIKKGTKLIQIMIPYPDIYLYSLLKCAKMHSFMFFDSPCGRWSGRRCSRGDIPRGDRSRWRWTILLRVQPRGGRERCRRACRLSCILLWWLRLLTGLGWNHRVWGDGAFRSRCPFVQYKIKFGE